jgi:hypothetical protein
LVSPEPAMITLIVVATPAFTVMVLSPSMLMGPPADRLNPLTLKIILPSVIEGIAVIALAIPPKMTVFPEPLVGTPFAFQLPTVVHAASAPRPVHIYVCVTIRSTNPLPVLTAPSKPVAMLIVAKDPLGVPLQVMIRYVPTAMAPRLLTVSVPPRVTGPATWIWSSVALSGSARSTCTVPPAPMVRLLPKAFAGSPAPIPPGARVPPFTVTALAPMPPRPVSASVPAFTAVGPV